MTHADWTLIVLACAAVVALVVLVTIWKVNAFIALTLASLLVGAGSVEMGFVPKDAKTSLTLLDVMDAFGGGLGRTLGGIAAVIGLGTMLGKLLAESGGAEVLAKRFAAIFGPRRAVWCIMVLGFVVGLPTWFAVGLVLLLPILLTLTRETGRPFLALAIPLVAALSVMHGLTPPHPGPVAALATLRDFQPNMGLVLMWAFIVGIPTAIIAGPIFARWVVPRVPVEAPLMPLLAGRESLKLPPFGLTLFSILLPVVLMLLDTLAKLTLPESSQFAASARFIGHPTIALTVSVLFASWSLGIRCGYSAPRILRFTEESIATIGMTLLVVGGGGGFAAVLKIAGAADAMGALAMEMELSPLLYGWLVAAFIRVATGSATVSITAAAGLLAPVLALHPGTNIELLIIAIGCGSLFLSHLNDGGFWIVKDCLGLTVPQTLRTWTVIETIVGVVGLAFTLGANALVQMLH
ncbi:MAG: gluconate:H+ symporter [Chthoniobacteraceae bacterium]